MVATNSGSAVVTNASAPGLNMTSDTIASPGSQPFYLSPNLLEALVKRAQLEGCSLQSLLLVAANVLHYRYTHQDSIQLNLYNFGTSKQVAPLRSICTPIYGDLKIRALLDSLVRQLETVTQLTTTPNESLSASEHLSQPSQTAIAVTFAANDLAPDTQPQKSDLHLILQQPQDGMAGLLEYNPQLLEPAVAQQWVNHLQILLTALAENLDGTIAQLPLLSATELNQLLVEWGSSETVNYPQIPIYQHIENHAVQTPTAIALKFQDQQLTYAELNQRANQLAHYLKTLGVTTGQAVAVCVQPSLEIAIVLLAIFKVGGVYVPLDPTHPVERLATILADTEADVLLTQSALLANLPQVTPHIMCLDRDWDKVQPLPTHNPNQAIDLDQTAYIIYTSGTTGKPKGVMATHRNLVNYILATKARFGFNQNDVMPVVARFTFSIAMFELLSPLVAGGTLVILERDHVLDYNRMAQTLESLTMLHTVPSLMQKLLTHINDNGWDSQKFRQVKHVFTGGDTVPPDLLETIKRTFPCANVYVLYGCSEVSSLCCSYPVSRAQTLTKSRIGRPFNNVSVRLYDADQNLVPVGVPGEIYVSGAGITRGYLNRDDLTQEKFVTLAGQRFYRTGDLGRWGSDGNIEFLGRADFQVKLRGIRIELNEIETILRQAPGVREGVVMAREIGTEEKSLVAYVVLDQAQNPVIADIRRFIQAKLPDYMVPSGFIVLDKMPLNPNQKVDRRALPLPTAENLAGLDLYVPARNELEQQLIQIWEGVLGIQPIGIQHNFFELGGNSLLAVQMLTQVEKLSGKNLPITTLLQLPTIAALAEFLITGTVLESSDLVPLRKQGTQPPLFCLYGVLLYRELADQLDCDRPIYGVYLQEEVDLLKTGRMDLFTSIFSDVPTIARRYLQTIRSLQPHGPYYLVGESFGGLVAFEMAQQLRTAGEEVALVGLLDSWVPNSRKRLPFLQALMVHGQMLYKQGLPYLLEKIIKDPDAWKAKIGKFLPGKREPLPAVEVPPNFDDVRDAMRQQADRDYIPQTYDGKAVLFRAMERDPFEVNDDLTMGWGEVVPGLQIHDVPGDHIGILASPNVAVLAKHLKPYLA